MTEKGASVSDPDPQANAVSVPSYDELMWPTLLALKAMGGSGTNEELLAKVIELEQFPPEVQAFLHTDHRQPKLNYNLAWAKTYLKKVAAIENSSRGVWSLTREGEKLTVQDVLSIPARVRRQFIDDKRAKEIDIPTVNEARANEQASPEVVDPAATLDSDDIEVTEPHWKDHLLRVLRAIRPDAFERLSQRLLREAGFIKVEVTGRSGDGGIDGIGVLRVNLLSFQVLFQCKRYQGSVSSSAIRDFRGAMVGRSDKGLLITTGTFTPDAKREATRDGAPAID